MSSTAHSDSPTLPGTDLVETAILEELLQWTDPDLVLEVGIGRGRMTGTIQSRARRYVGLDIDGGLLAAQRHRRGPSASVAWLQGDVRRLPLADQSITTAVILRLFHRFEDSYPLLQEVHRILRPSGRLVISVDPRPSLATLALDVWNGLSGRGASDAVTFSNRSDVIVRSTRNPGYLTTRTSWAELIRRAGFSVEASRGCGLERFRPFRWIPPTIFVKIAPLLGSRWGVPSDLLLLRSAPANESVDPKPEPSTVLGEPASRNQGSVPRRPSW